MGRGRIGSSSGGGGGGGSGDDRGVDVVALIVEVTIETAGSTY